MTDTQITTPSILASLSNELADTVERAGAAVVTIDARRRHPASGIVWSADGLIVTANHVVERDEEIGVAFADGRTLAAGLVGRDPASDLALLSVAESDLATGGLAPLPHAAEPRVGALSLALGRPGPSGVMASLGAVTSVGGPLRFRGGASLPRFVRADVAMLPGFSGGPLVDMTGALIGLNSSTLGHSGQLTVPAASIAASIETLLQHGHVRRGYLGIGAQTVHLPQALADSAGQRHGLLIVSVEESGPAAAAGLMLGDVLLGIGGEPVEHVEQLQDRLTGDRVGVAVPVRIVRGGEAQDVPVTIAERRQQAE
ncbi:MAG: trypsin-like peptidase domain-containing protein [Thermomicrobiales bacterium]